MATSEQDTLTEDRYGFTWGPMRVLRATSHERFGYVLIVGAGDQEVTIRCSPKGRKLECTCDERKYTLPEVGK